MKGELSLFVKLVFLLACSFNALLRALTMNPFFNIMKHHVLSSW